jgi:transposase
MSMAQSNGKPELRPAERTKDLARRAGTGRPYPEELRSRVITAVEEGASYREAAARYGVSASAAVKWAHQFRETGSSAAKPMGGDRRSRLKSEREWLVRRIAADPELTPAELHKELCERGIQVGYLTVRRFIKREIVDLKKERALETARPPTNVDLGPHVIRKKPTR